MHFDNRITRMLGIEIPVIQAPMGWIARAPLASAVSNAGGMGIIETSSGELEVIREEIRRMRTLTSKPFGVNIAQAFVKDPGIANFVIDQGVRFVTTSAGSPERYTAPLKAAGLTVFHVVPTLKAAIKAVEAGVDGLVVEGCPWWRRAASSTDVRWSRPSRWVQRLCSSARGWSRRWNRPSTRTGKRPSCRPPKPTPCS
jgi:enoyl-[acyl-carrier protein] reductase II